MVKKATLEKGELVAGMKGKEITIKKMTAKDFFVNGNLSEEYFRIRKTLYQMFDVV